MIGVKDWNAVDSFVNLLVPGLPSLVLSIQYITCGSTRKLDTLDGGEQPS